MKPINGTLAVKDRPKEQPIQDTSRQNLPDLVIPGAIYDFKTTNKSFIKTQQQLGLLGVKNNAFHLILLNPNLQGVDPYDPNLSVSLALQIIQECKLNIFYYLREVVRIEEDGGAVVPFRMDRATLAATYCFINNINLYLIKPRQTGKTVGVLALLSWAFKFSGPNSNFLFSNYKDDTAKKNLRGMKNILNSLPSYISNAGTTDVDKSGKNVKKTDNIKTYSEPTSKNSAMVASVASTIDAAEVVGRGYTQAYQYFDEAEFIKYLDIIVKVSGMAFNTASANAAKNGSGYCRIFTSTPGDLGNKKSCARTMTIINDTVPWDEKFYDYPIHQFKELVNRKSNFGIVYISYDYKQLGLGEDWFRSACKNVGGDVDKIKREILLQRFSGNSDSPFTREDIEELDANKKTPLFTKTIAKIYNILFYEIPNKNRMYFMGVDPSGGTGGDNYAITVIDPYTLKVVAEFKSAYMTEQGCCDLINFIVKQYMPKTLIVVERNRNGGSVIELLKKSPVRNMVYASMEANSDTTRIRDKMDENGFIKEEFIRNKYFGTNTTSSTRAVMMHILMDAVQFAKHLITSKYLVEDILNLVVKNGRIEAAPGEHDDNVMSWLLCMYVYYYGERLERYGFRKGELPNDIQESDEFAELRRLYSNPEIKKQFPTMYSFFLDAQERNKREQLLNAPGEIKQAESMMHKIGGLETLSGRSDGRISNSYNPEIDVHIDGVPDTMAGAGRMIAEETWKRSMINKFRNINK